MSMACDLRPGDLVVSAAPLEVGAMLGPFRVLMKRAAVRMKRPGIPMDTLGIVVTNDILPDDSDMVGLLMDGQLVAAWDSTLRRVEGPDGHGDGAGASDTA